MKTFLPALLALSSLIPAAPAMAAAKKTTGKSVHPRTSTSRHKTGAPRKPRVRTPKN